MRLFGQLWREDAGNAAKVDGHLNGGGHGVNLVGKTDAAAADSPARGGIRVVTPHLGPNSPVFPFDGRDLRSAEQYKLIRTRIVHHNPEARVIAVSSPQVGDGKTVTAINIAGALALRPEAKTLLVDVDCRRSKIAEGLGISPSPGVTDVLKGACSLEEAAVRLDSPHNLYVLPAGRGLQSPTELLDSKNWAALVAGFRSAFSFTVIDTPPVGIVADFELVQSVVDGVVLVIRPDHTNRDRCYFALGAVTEAKLIGVVTNCVPDWILTRSHSHDYGYYSGAAGRDDAAARAIDPTGGAVRD